MSTSNATLQAVETPQPNLQDGFLAHLCAEQLPLTVYLVNGVKLGGIVTRYDSQSFILTRDGHSQLVYKHSVSTMMPVEAIDITTKQ